MNLYRVTVIWDCNGVPMRELENVKAPSAAEAECAAEKAVAMRIDGTLAYRVNYLAWHVVREA